MCQVKRGIFFILYFSELTTYVYCHPYTIITIYLTPHGTYGNKVDVTVNSYVIFRHRNSLWYQ